MIIFVIWSASPSPSLLSSPSPLIDSIAVSVFADIFIGLTNTRYRNIRRQDSNNYSDTETRCLVYICLLLTWIVWPSDKDSVQEGNKSKMKVFALTLAFVVVAICFKIAPKKKQGNQGCREQTMGSWRARLS